MTTLTVYRGECIASLIVRNKFDPIQTELKIREAALAQRAYEMQYSAQERAFMNSAPQGCMQTAGTITVKYANHGGAFIQLGYSETNSAVFRRIFATRNSITFQPMTFDDPLCADIEKFAADKKQYDTDRKAAYKQLKELMKTFRTVEKLLQSWPEVAVFVEQTAPVEIQVPAVNYAALNDAFELPPEKKVA